MGYSGRTSLKDIKKETIQFTDGHELVIDHEKPSQMPRDWQICSIHLNDLEKKIAAENITDIETQINYSKLLELHRIADVLQLYILKEIKNISLHLENISENTALKAPS